LEDVEEDVENRWEDDTVACKIGFRFLQLRNSRRTVFLQLLAFVYARAGLASAALHSG
jgi:hypothetical protein